MNRINAFFVKIPKSIFMGILFLLLLLCAIAFDGSTILEKVQIWGVANTYNTLISICPSVTIFAHDNKILLLIFTAIDLFCLFYKPRIILVCEISFSPDIAQVAPGLLKNYRVNKKVIDQTKEMGNLQIIEAVKKQDAMILEVMKKRDNDSLCFYGIAHTPLVFRLGFKIGDQNNIMFLHKRRTNNSLFEELSDDRGTLVINCSEINESIESQDMIVAISTSLKITEQNIESLTPENKHVVFFTSNNIGFDSILNYYDAENAKNTIMHNVRDIAKKYNVKTIHLVMASSVAFTCLLAQSYSEQHDPILIVYHYQNNIYPWGICINEVAERCLVENSAVRT